MHAVMLLMERDIGWPVQREEPPVRQGREFSRAIRWTVGLISIEADDIGVILARSRSWVFR